MEADGWGRFAWLFLTRRDDPKETTLGVFGERLFPNALPDYSNHFYHAAWFEPLMFGVFRMFQGKPRSLFESVGSVPSVINLPRLVPVHRTNPNFLTTDFTDNTEGEISENIV